MRSGKSNDLFPATALAALSARQPSKPGGMGQHESSQRTWNLDKTWNQIGCDKGLIEEMSMNHVRMLSSGKGNSNRAMMML